MFSCTALWTQQKKITIWIHGTMVPMPEFAKRSYCRIGLGLHPINAYAPTDHLYNIARVLTELDPDNFDIEHYYTYGWPGNISFAQRQEAGAQLYHEICNLIEEYQAIYNETPFVRIIGHSHGGNVILNIAHALKHNRPITIDEIILLATPVQDATKEYVCHDCFKKVYAFYSKTDITQIIDPQGLYADGQSTKLYSERTFDYHDKLRQAAIKIQGYSIAHIDFIRMKFIVYLPELLKKLDHICATVIPEQKMYNKILNIEKHRGEITIHTELACA